MSAADGDARERADAGQLSNIAHAEQEMKALPCLRFPA